MHALRPLFASLLLAAFAGGGVLLPAWHSAEHGLEQAEERAEHEAEHHAESAAGPLAQAPCPTAPHHVDCAVCSGVTTGTEAETSTPLAPPEAAGAESWEAERVTQTAAFGSGARAPPAA